ncbi:MAG: GyrI-like domain-containing protein [Bacteroidia bacterium]
MNIETTPAKTYLLTRHTINFSELTQVGPPAVNAIFAELEKRQLKRAGNIEFIYHNFSQDKPFVLEVGIPVADTIESTDENFAIVKRPEFRNISHIHNGSMSSMKVVYGNLFEEIRAKAMPYNGEIREVYTIFSHPEAADNVTEIQIGLN